MTDALTQFPPHAAHAHARLDAFVPAAAGDYARLRNFDHGRGAHKNVSVLSPYLRARVLDEPAVTRAVLAHHSAQDADKFLTEVFWRTYWKGWMELRPSVWANYLGDLNRLRDDIQTQSGLRAQWEAACTGQTGIAPFDAWATELTTTGYLHNHARMWFASIWIFTLGLPWQLGADFFLRHLLDGDAAVNTLSWRWVAGIQTRGKTYLATADNIAKFTGGRYRDVAGLAQSAPALAASENPPITELAACTPLPLPARYGILTHDDEVDLNRLLELAPNPTSCAFAQATAGHSPWHMAPHVADFRARLADDAAQGFALNTLTSAHDIAAWATAHQLEQIVAPYASTGPVRTIFEAYSTLPDAVPLSQYRRPLDTFAWPLATKGFFPFRKYIPKLISKFAS